MRIPVLGKMGFIFRRGTGSYNRGCQIDIISVSEVGATEYQQPFEANDSKSSEMSFTENEQWVQWIAVSDWVMHVNPPSP